MRADIGDDIECGVSDFVALLNQSLEYGYSNVIISGELANLRVSKNRWVYFDLKDDNASVKFFGTVHQLPGPLEDGMLLRVSGTPHLHQLYGFSVTVSSIQAAGEGSIKRAAELLQTKLLQEGLFDPVRKRALPYPPSRIGLIASRQSAAYADFIKILGARWQGIEIDLIDVQVQGSPAPSQIVAAISHFNRLALTPDVLVLIRGGGSPEDLAAFSTEQVTRAVAASRIVTLVAIGHEVDVSLAELAADGRGSTPSNAAELLVPDKKQVLLSLEQTKIQLAQLSEQRINAALRQLVVQRDQINLLIDERLKKARQGLASQADLLTALSPIAILKRGYALVRKQGSVVRQANSLRGSDTLELQFQDGSVKVTVKGSMP